MYWQEEKNAEKFQQQKFEGHQYSYKTSGTEVLRISTKLAKKSTSEKKNDSKKSGVGKNFLKKVAGQNPLEISICKKNWR